MLGRYEIRVDTAFEQVLAACADPRRPHGWIDEDIGRVYRELHARGVVHSVEAWAGGELVGGLYGVSLGGLFAGESMFHDPVRGRDASKAALVALVEVLRSGARRRGRAGPAARRPVAHRPPRQPRRGRGRPDRLPRAAARRP